MKEIGVLLVLLSYLLGSIPFSYIFSRTFGGVDIRTKGTGNVGATNVLRSLGIKIAVASLIGDVLKGLVSAWLGYYFGGIGLAAVCSVAVVVGHCWPITLRFRGGKGVATAAGIMLVLMPLIFVLEALVVVVIAGTTRYVSLGSVCAAILFPILVIFSHQPWQYIIMSIILGAIVIFRHRSNIRRLRQGTESKLNEKVL